MFRDIVIQGEVLAHLISSLQVDTMGKECMEEGKHLYFYKNVVPIPPLGLVDIYCHTRSRGKASS